MRSFISMVLLVLLITFTAGTGSGADTLSLTDGLIRIGQSIVIVTSDNPGPVEKSAVRIFMSRFHDRCRSNISTATITEYNSLKVKQPYSFPIFAGISGKHSIITDTCQTRNIDIPNKSEGYLLLLSAPDKSLPLKASGYGIVCGADPRGLLYGLGRLLRSIDYENGPTVKPAVEVTSPAVKDRGVYLAMHFKNYYEAAPIADVQAYVEDCALWGFNTVYTLFGIGGYPRDAGKDPSSYVSQMASRIRKINETAHSLGMKTGFIGEANEGWIFYPELKAVKPSSPAVYRPYGTICPSQPEGLKLILEYRREVLDLIGPIDEFCLWPYDSGGCACDQCSDEHGWTKTYLKIGPMIADVVKEKNPNAKIILSTWLMDEAERKMVYDQCDRGVNWFDGVMTQSETAGEHKIGPQYSLFVFPEISMFACYFTSYGCNGANPAPVKFSTQAKHAADLNYGAVLYSEGNYEDINKVIWAATLWNPDRKPEDIAAEYAGYYFGEKNRKTGADLIMGLEGTWGSVKLEAAKPETVNSLLQMSESIKGSTPSAAWSADRMLLLYYRAKMDSLMKTVGTDQAIHQQATQIYYAVRVSGNGASLKDDLKKFHNNLNARSKNLDSLFGVYWDYLKHFDLDEVTLVFRPDEYTGKVDYRALLDASGAALKSPNEKSMREIMLNGYQKFFWTNNVDYSIF